MKLLLTPSGGEFAIADRPGARLRPVGVNGPDAAQRLAANAHRLPKRLTFAIPWLAAQGLPMAEIARTLRASDVAECGWLRPRHARR